ncbi:glycosyltransferase family 4 protein [Poseidonibacter lekithochrous]|uniref:glycosyltransferase family 4 protein n=1 Tax=Poseidonibacter TaxID=2321187 RepID=UPI001C08EF43|nr:MULTISPECIES: glycosyltransferase family 1 protein [Poseidonibacter]MBU3014243.1 glycosyltransferase family 4 protein [Poseidonibacter lekithochrous]MDO6827540.1 glycosyltransferase family 1 protein [Poseidonibacter sp. 1_MG-2023]
MTEIYIDITQYITNRLNTGIQRVVKEYLIREVKQNKNLYVLFYDLKNKNFSQIQNDEVLCFLENVAKYEFKNISKIDIFKENKNKKIFFDIDSVWNSPLKRDGFYKELKEGNFLIYNFIYDLIPILFPHFMYEQTINNFKPYIDSIFKYSDFVFFDSNSAMQDFSKIQEKSNFPRKINKKVIYLGSDFNTSKNVEESRSSKYEKLLSKKYILFVGTLEPRKNQELILDAFDELYKNNPDLNLIFIGKIGWNVENLVYKINNHKLKDKNLFHLLDVEDSTLNKFYQNAYIVTYLSHYEGYGLPIIESLQYCNITLVSKNSSMPEVGGIYVEYIENNSKKSIISIINQYLKNQALYTSKKSKIKDGFKAKNWELFYFKISKYLT